MAEIISHFPILLEAVPLIGAALTPIIGRWRRKICFPFALVIVSLALGMSVYLARTVYLKGPISYHLGGYEPPWGIEIFFDELSASAVFITALCLAIIIFSKLYVEKALVQGKIPLYYTLVLVNMAGMLGFVATGDIFNMFVFLEIVSLSAYGLTAISGEKTAEMAAFKYLLVGAISTFLILMAIAFLYSITGTLNMHDLSLRLQEAPYPRVAGVAFALFIVGFGVKAALFPLHIWLPDAHSIAPSPVSALLSGLVVKTGLLGILRVISIYKFNGLANITPVTTALAWLGAAAILVGAFSAIFQDDIKMMLAYSTVSNIGYIALGIGLGSVYGLLGGIIHILNHAIMKVTLFLSAGAIIHQTGSRKLSELKGIGKRMPLTMAAMVIGALSIVGIPPTNGFIAKWYIALGALKAGKPFFVVILLLGALLIFAYYAKVLNTAYFKMPEKENPKQREAPLSMLIPIIVLAASCLIVGVLAYWPVAFIRPWVERLLEYPK